MATKYVVREGMFDFLDALYGQYDKGAGANGIVHMYKVTGASITIWSTGTLLIQGKEEGKYKDIIEGLLYVPYSKDAEDDLPQACIIGSDEVGNGSYTGGMTAAAVYVPLAMVDSLKALGIKDSKSVSDSRIPQLAEEIKKYCPHFVMSLSPKQYNRAISKGYNQVSLKVLMHNYCAVNLQNAYHGLKFDGYIVDGFTNQQSWDNYVVKEKEPTKVKAKLVPHAESLYLAVAAASILARDSFLKQIEYLSIESGINLHQGVTSYVREDVLALKSRGFDLNDFVKLHFKNTEIWGLK